ncbi:Beta-1,4-N-acetylgalactosaminyltransferase 3 [Oryzias melastigma]|uniref:Beta-1,4-N-acetylgalactosaminyltransferase n=1 Tax=Oryzias melastigma TaxID=30732 RepID=A0A834FJ14_ORYME|nr:Beta-1,4-N-acetylgalactosaminyltransferase 3 [Oryzias melastigma]
MIRAFFPLKKLRRNCRYFLLGAILLVGAVAVYNEFIASSVWRSDSNSGIEDSTWQRPILDQSGEDKKHSASVEDSAAWISRFRPQTWKPEFIGQANLHVFEDWCGSSIADLHRNMHYPLYPHSRTTVKKLAVSPQWTNYGLRIFGYLHPFTDGDFVFALSSDDNSEFWLSTDDSPLNLRMLTWVGKTGREWTAPGEFDKYASQTSRPVWLTSRRRYFFEIIHKQNDKGTDHVEVAWQLLNQDFTFALIESNHISLYVNESAFLMTDVSHIPQTAASHQRAPTKQLRTEADMLREDPRDELYRVDLINNEYLEGVLPDCSYKPSYIIKDFPLLRYQGLQFVHLSYIFPNDYTRLTHMETENSCFYSESPEYMRMYGFSRYMTFDHPFEQTREDMDFAKFNEEEENINNYIDETEKKNDRKTKDNALYPEYGDNYDNSIQKQKRWLLSFDNQEQNSTRGKPSAPRLNTQELQGKHATPQPPLLVSMDALKHQQQNQTQIRKKSSLETNRKKKLKGSARRKKKLRVKQQIDEEIKDDKKQNKSEGLATEQLPLKQHLNLVSSEKNQTKFIQKIKDSQAQNTAGQTMVTKRSTRAHQKTPVTRKTELRPANTKHFTAVSDDTVNRVESSPGNSIRAKEIELNMPLNGDEEKSFHKYGKSSQRRTNKKRTQTTRGERLEDNNLYKSSEIKTEANNEERVVPWWEENNFNADYEDSETPAPVFDVQVNWNQTFKVNPLNLQRLRSDWIDLQCNVSGNLVLPPTDALPIVKGFMDSLNDKYDGQFTLERVVNVVKRADLPQGSRYLLELVLKDANGQRLRLSRYIYALKRYSKKNSWGFGFQASKPKTVLCNPVGFRWDPSATVHFIVPVKNQARWVRQLIDDMEQLFKETGDGNFNLIITDYSSTDMDVRNALEKSSLPRYQYVKLSGNFERSAGLQTGIDLIKDDNSIVFLCDLHIRFPPSIIDTIRKHCIKGHMAFAPIVLRLDCGTTASEARGYWEVNGFGLLGIYKSDLDSIGGMNTMEFKDRWGGEDWELLDRILQAGLEVERIYLRNFFHYYHSKRGMWNRPVSTSNR